MKTPKTVTSVKTASKSPARKRRTRAKSAVPSAGKVAEHLGVELKPRLTTERIRHMRRALPGYIGLLDDTARQLEADGEELDLADLLPADLLAVQREQQELAAREAVAETVYRSVYEQRLEADDRGMAMLQRIARRVTALAGEDPSLLARWKFLMDFLGTFRPGAPPRKPAPAPGADANR